jgi:hypothetical protein
MIKPGEEWGAPTAAAPDVEIRGDDANLAANLPLGLLVRFVPTDASDLALAVGIDPAALRGVALPLDVMRVTADGREALAVNIVVAGTSPDRLTARSPSFAARVTVDGRPVHDGPATTVVVAVGQFLRGNDVAPRGHPGDGRAEVQVYAVGRRERRAVRDRLRTGTHVPHPAITQRSGRRIDVVFDTPQPMERDGDAQPPTSEFAIEIVESAYQLLV